MANPERIQPDPADPTGAPETEVVTVEKRQQEDRRRVVHDVLTYYKETTFLSRVRDLLLSLEQRPAHHQQTAQALLSLLQQEGLGNLEKNFGDLIWVWLAVGLLQLEPAKQEWTEVVSYQQKSPNQQIKILHHHDQYSVWARVHQDGDTFHDYHFELDLEKIRQRLDQVHAQLTDLIESNVELLHQSEALTYFAAELAVERELKILKKLQQVITFFVSHYQRTERKFDSSLLQYFKNFRMKVGSENEAGSHTTRALQLLKDSGIFTYTELPQDQNLPAMPLERAIWEDDEQGGRYLEEVAFIFPVGDQWYVFRFNVDGVDYDELMDDLHHRWSAAEARVEKELFLQNNLLLNYRQLIDNRD
ncbi:MAG TPA: hypothetical protein VF209_04235 [Patescibacteria group bacterium]